MPPSRCRLTREPLAVTATVPEAVRALAGEPWLVALCGAWAGGGAVVASAPVAFADDPVAAWAQQPEVDGVDGVDGVPEAGVGGGWFGWLGVEVARRIERLPPGPPRPSPFPEAQVAFYDHVVRRDAAGAWWFEALRTDDAARSAALDARRDALRALLVDPPVAQPTSVDPFTLAAPGAHLRAVADTVEAIRDGELFQANVCARWDTRLHGDAAHAFAEALGRLAPPYAALTTSPDGRALLSFSPELFLERRGRRVRSAPIKGTAALGAGAELAASAKDRAENVMIVDLVRNDLGRVCDYGTVRVDALAEPRELAGVLHLVSEVSGTLFGDLDDAKLLQAAFPPGSVTGAPKVQALKAIARLEQTGREAFTGAIGFASPTAGLELNVAIRTLHVAPDGHAWLGTGGGVTAASTPEGELEECRTKAHPIATALQTTLVSDRATTQVSDRACRTPNAISRTGPQRPDPEKGVFTTLLVAGGRPHDLELHLARLARSATDLYGVELPSDLAQTLSTLGTADLRARVHVRPDGKVRVSTKPLDVDPTAAPKPLVPFVLPGGLGAHKWADRRLIDELTRRADGGTPLLIDGDGEVLEASYAAVLLVEDGRLVAPPDDHRRLPSTTVSRLGDVVHRERFDLQRLLDADQVVLASAIRGPHATAGVARTCTV